MGIPSKELHKVGSSEAYVPAAVPKQDQRRSEAYVSTAVLKQGQRCYLLSPNYWNYWCYYMAAGAVIVELMS